MEQLAPYNPLEPYVAFPRPGGLLPWGNSGSGETFYWRTGTTPPDDWPVVAFEAHGSQSFEFDGFMSEFMLELFTGRLEIPFIRKLNEDFNEDLDELEVLEFIPSDGSWPYPNRLEAVGYFDS